MQIKVGSSVDEKKLKDSKEGIIPFTLTTKSVDRDSEVVLPSGAIVDSFKENPVFVWVHDIRNKPPIGKLLTDTFDITEQHFKSDVQFDLDDPFAKMIYNKYLNGFLNAGSIRFRAKEIGDPILPGQKGATIESWELLEFSAVPVPANPEALAGIQKSIASEEKSIETERELMFEISKYLKADDWLKEMETFESKTYVKEIEYEFDDKETDLAKINSKSLAIVNEYEKDVPEDATIIECPEFNEISHPHAGKTVQMKEMIFVPPLKTKDGEVYWISQWKDNVSDDEMLSKHISKDSCKLSDTVATLTKQEKDNVELFKMGYDTFMVEGAFTNKTIEAISKSIGDLKIEKQIAEPIAFEVAAGKMVKLLEDDEEYGEDIRKMVYNQLCLSYEKEGKKAPEYRKGNFKKIDDNSNPIEGLSEEQKKLIIIEAATQLAEQELSEEK